MSDQQPTTITGAATKISTSLIGALPSQFLMLCLINVCFLGIIMWFLSRVTDAEVHLAERRMAQYDSTITSCMALTRELALRDTTPAAR